MSDFPVQVVIAAFGDEHGADQTLHALKEDQENGLITIRDAAIVYRDDNGKLHIEDNRRHGVGRGAAIGGVCGAIVGLMTGPVGWATGGGAVIGALASRLRQSGFRDDRLEHIGEALQPGTSALVAVIDQTWLKEVAGVLSERAHEVVTAAIQADLAAQLEAGQDVAYTALDIAERTATARSA